MELRFEKMMKVDGNERLISLIVHLSPVVGLPIVIPVIVYLAKKGENALSGINAARALNFHLTMILLFFIARLSTFLIIGEVILPLLILWCAIQIIIALIATYRSVPYRYFPALPVFSG
jgi:uncharacterized Tic20 family protein